MEVSATRYQRFLGSSVPGFSGTGCAAAAKNLIFRSISISGSVESTAASMPISRNSSFVWPI